MRVLIVDQDSAMLETITRSLRDDFVIDAVTNKGDCLDLLKQNAFDVIVACERLADGSGLELLGQVARRWPEMKRVFAVERDRMRLLRGRLGPFELFQTLAYPIDPDRLLSVLELADSAHEALSPDLQQAVLDQSEEFTEEEEAQAPQLQASASVQHQSGGSSQASVSAPLQRARPSRTNTVGTAASISTLSWAGSSASSAPARTTAFVRAPSRAELGLSEQSGPVASPQKKSPVRFADVPRSQAQTAPSSEPIDLVAQAATMARTYHADVDRPPDEPEGKRSMMLVGAGVAVALGLIFLGHRLLSGGGEPARQARAAPAAAAASRLSQEVNERAGKIDAPGSADSATAAPPKDRKAAARSDHAKHHGESASQSIPESATADRTDGHPTHQTSASTTSPSAETSAIAAAANETTSVPPGFSRAAAAGTAPAAVGRSDSGAASPDSATADTPASATPPTASSGSTPSGSAAIARSSAALAPASATPAQSAAAAETTSASAKTSAPANQTNSGEPPPVIREAKLIRRVNPDYPSAARRAGVQGSVDLNVTVAQDGAVKSVSVAHSTPPETFDNAALTAVRRWKYDPRFVDGLPTEAHLKVHLDFSPDADAR